VKPDAPHGLIFFAAFVLLFGWRMYRRYRSHVGPQKVRPLRMGLRVGLLGLVTVLIMISPVGVLGREVLGLGIALGAMLGALSLSQTHFETREGRYWYTPNVYIGMAVTAVLAARMLYRLVVLYPQIQAGTLPHGGSPLANMSIPTLAVFGLVIGYYAIYNGGVLWRSRQLMEEAPPSPAA
jgi:hypothetical protein